MRTEEQMAIFMINGMTYAMRGQMVGAVTEEEFCDMASRVAKRGLTFLPQKGDLTVAAYATAPPNLSMYLIHLKKGVKRTLIFDSSPSGARHQQDQMKSYTVTWPTSYLLLWSRNRVIGNGYLYLAEEKVRSATDLLRPFPLPNLDGLGQICIGGWRANAADSLEEQVESYVDQFFSSSFNNDMNGWQNRVPEAIRSPENDPHQILAKWDEFSINEEPLNWNTTNNNTPVSIKRLLDQNWGEVED